MKLKLGVLILTGLLAIQAQAQTKTKKTVRRSKPATPAAPAPKSSSSSVSSSAAAEPPKAKRAGRPNENGWRLTYLLWQETVKVTNGPADANMTTQSQGIQGSYVMSRPFSSARWNSIYTIDVAAGTIKGAAGTTAIPDKFGNQAWFFGGASAGLTYRTSVVSQINFIVPAAFRMISWRLTAGSATNPDKDTGFSVGYGAQYVQQLTPRSQIQFGLTRQYMWASTQWTVGWQTMFK